ncbi:DNA cytosine methyltransferase [Streptomyces sp. cg28]|uniref:DNA cytosine methyltransferase n=1 Tax=Streptomyces sp. cg28 TaxID=3403457 RepID=UPI003B20BE47
MPLERSDYLKLDPHESSCTPETFTNWLAEQGNHRPLAVDLFSGAGGLSLGLKQAGWQVAAAVDADERALETHAANFPGLSLHLDLGNPEHRERLVELLRPAGIDLVAGGPPCQPFSRAGRSKIRSLVQRHGRDPYDRRKELWVAYLDIVLALKPRAVLMENVPDMGLGDDFFVTRTIEAKLQQEGYVTQVRLVDAWTHGVPQHRKRLILLARNDVDRIEWPDAVEKRTSLRDAIGDLPVIEQGETGGRALTYNEPSSLPTFARRMRAQARQDIVHDHMTRHVRPDDREIFEGMTSRTLYRDIPAHLRRYDTEHFKDKYKRLDWDDLSRTITAHIAKDGYGYIHPEQHRTLSVREAARIQTFPDWFRFAGVRSDAFRQIGNAVPPMLGQAAAEALRPIQGSAPNTQLRSRWLDVREDLAVWAEKQRDAEAWFHFPGSEMGPVQAVVAAALSSSKLATSVLAEAMNLVKGEKTLRRSTFAKLLGLAPTDRLVISFERLRPLVGKSVVWRNPLEIPDRVNFKGAETSLYRLLLGEDLLLVGQGQLRVAARVNGSTADRSNRLSDGRVDLARLIGAGEDAPLRMAGIRRIGMTVCRETEPYCTDCPLRPHCVQRANTF